MLESCTEGHSPCPIRSFIMVETPAAHWLKPQPGIWLLSSLFHPAVRTDHCSSSSDLKGEAMLPMQIHFLLLRWTLHYVTQDGHFRTLWCNKPLIPGWRIVSQGDSKGNATDRIQVHFNQHVRTWLKTIFQKDWRCSCFRINVPL